MGQAKHNPRSRQYVGERAEQPSGGPRIVARHQPLTCAVLETGSLKLKSGQKVKFARGTYVKENSGALRRVNV
jgi:hypothetical protein